MDIGKERGTLHVWPEGKIPPDRLAEVEGEAIRLLLLGPERDQDPSALIGTEEEFLVVCSAVDGQFYKPCDWSLYRLTDLVTWYQALVREYLNGEYDDLEEVRFEGAVEDPPSLIDKVKLTVE